MNKQAIQQVKNRFGIVGNHPLLINAIERAIKVASTDFSVLIRGESGVGKENISKIIHYHSKRKHHSLIAVNCGAIPEGTIDSELFGHEKGSFTGATNSRKGYFEEANDGTIFLDEIGDMPLLSQVKLLRVLENGEYLKVGASNTKKVDTRVIAATNVNLGESIQNQKFREDLYYRLSTVEIYLPPLRERTEDIPILFRKFLIDFSDKYRTGAIYPTAEALKVLQEYHWPGNIRELKNISERIAIFEKSGDLEANTIKNYLSQLKSNYLPSIYKPSSQDNQFSSEREILYQVLFDMKAELKEVKDVLQQVVQESERTDIVSEHPNLFAPQNTSLNLASTTKIQSPSEIYPVTKASPEKFEAVKQTIAYAEDQVDDVLESENLSLKEMEIALIKKVLEKHKGKRKLAAQELAISERTLYRKINEYDLG